MRVAALDLGSNTFLCLIAEVSESPFSIQQIFHDEVQVVRLGEGLSGQPMGNKYFSSEALKRADQCLGQFAELIKKHKPDRTLAMATAAAREVQNKDDLLDLGHKYNIPIEIIPGEKEALITYQGAVSGLISPAQLAKDFVILDIGGGSTELILGRGAQVLQAHSFSFGCVNLTERFLKKQPAASQALTDLRQWIDKTVAEKSTLFGFGSSFAFENLQLIAVAGTPTELARVSLGGVFDASKIDGFKLTQQDLKDWQFKFSQCSVSEIQSKYGVSAGRADLILSGVVILQSVMSALRKSELQVSTRGVRFGVALELAGRRIAQSKEKSQ